MRLISKDVKDDMIFVYFEITRSWIRIALGYPPPVAHYV